jgi:hypothetical protein
MHQFDNPLVMTEEGYFVSDKWLRFSEILQDFDPYLELRWIPPKNRTDPEKSKPYAICHCLPDKIPYAIRFMGDEDDPIQVLADLWEGRVNNENNILTKLDALEKAQEAFRLKKDLEELEERTDLFHFLATDRSPFTARIRDSKGELIKLNTMNGRRVK